MFIMRGEEEEVAKYKNRIHTPKSWKAVVPNNAELTLHGCERCMIARLWPQ